MKGRKQQQKVESSVSVEKDKKHRRMGPFFTLRLTVWLFKLCTFTGFSKILNLILNQTELHEPTVTKISKRILGIKKKIAVKLTIDVTYTSVERENQNKEGRVWTLLGNLDSSIY